MNKIKCFQLKINLNSNFSLHLFIDFLLLNKYQNKLFDFTLLIFNYLQRIF